MQKEQNLKLHKDIWYELLYEQGAEYEDTVLYTSFEGLRALRQELERIEINSSSDVLKLEIDDVDSYYDLPFSHICVTDFPYRGDDRTDIFGEYIAIFLVLSFFALAVYGAFHLFVDIFW